MCHTRLSLGQSPACVSACPTGAIQIEIVNVNKWRASVAAGTGVASGLPAGDQSISSTRITLPANLAPNAKPVDLVHLKPSDPHWALVVMTVFTQMAVGAFATIFLLQLLGALSGLGAAAVTALAVATVALAASTLHLGRPVHAYRALKMWRRSWLSREVLLFTGFSAVAGCYALWLWMGLAGGSGLGALTVLLGFGGVTASACIYLVPSRPAWNTPLTLVQFNLTALTLGPLFAAAAIGTSGISWLPVVIASTAGVQFIVLALRFFRLSGSDAVERQASSRLLATTLRTPFMARGALLALGAIALPLSLSTPFVWWAAFLLALAGETIGRYLFFVSAVPKHLAAPYLGSEAA
jgi:DMSO reductase anchor subunit